MSLRLGDLGGGQTRTWARPAGRRSPREKTGEAYDPSQILGAVFLTSVQKKCLCRGLAGRDSAVRAALRVAPPVVIPPRVAPLCWGTPLGTCATRFGGARALGAREGGLRSVRAVGQRVM